MGSIGVPDTVVSLPDNPKAWSCSNLPATTNRKPVIEQHISDLRELVDDANDGSILLVPGDEGYEDSLRRWSRAAEKRAVSTIVTPSRRCQDVFEPPIVCFGLDFLIFRLPNSVGFCSLHTAA
jgi:hypothetical protein